MPAIEILCVIISIIVIFLCALYSRISIEIWKLQGNGCKDAQVNTRLKLLARRGSGKESDDRKVQPQDNLKKSEPKRSKKRVPQTERYTFEEFQFGRYHCYNHMYSFIVNELQELYPELISIDVIGHSSEGRDLLLVKISKVDPGKPSKPVVLVDAGVHAREWIAPASAVYTIHQLLQPQHLYLLEHLDWWVVPVVNPDGYEYSRTSSQTRLWRKTRSVQSKSTIGVDGNRNFSYMWNTSGVGNKKSPTFPGPSPFSEPETRAIRDIFLENKGKIKLYVTLHAYGRYIMFPWAYKKQVSLDYYKFQTMAKKVSRAIFKACKIVYKVKPASALYTASGTSFDFAYAVGRIPHCFLFELTSGHKFVLPENLLQDNIEEAWIGIKTFGELIEKIYFPPPLASVSPIRHASRSKSQCSRSSKSSKFSQRSNKAVTVSASKRKLNATKLKSSTHHVRPKRKIACLAPIKPRLTTKDLF